MSAPLLSADQHTKLKELERLARDFNTKINLYSEASTQSFWERHIEHSLALAIHSFPSDAIVVDWGTGGGMPGLPLAILFPNVDFHLVDSVGKKLRAVKTIARRLELDNVHTWHVRAEEWRGVATHSVSRATAPLETLWGWHERAQTTDVGSDAPGWRPGLICLKGGDLDAEIADLHRNRPHLSINIIPLSDSLKTHEPDTKVIVEVHVP